MAATLHESDWKSVQCLRRQMIVVSSTTLLSSRTMPIMSHRAPYCAQSAVNQTIAGIRRLLEKPRPVDVHPQTWSRLFSMTKNRPPSVRRQERLVRWLSVQCRMRVNEEAAPRLHTIQTKMMTWLQHMVDQLREMANSPNNFQNRVGNSKLLRIHRWNITSLMMKMM